MLGTTIQTRQGPITIATLYSPPRTDYINPIDFNNLLKRHEPVYFIGDLNARHPILGHNSHNNKGQNIKTYIDQYKCKHEGPLFPTFIRHNSSTTPDIALSNMKTFHNFHMTPGPLTPSDHIPIIATITCSPIQIPIRPRKSFHRANWAQYKTDLSNITIPTDPNPTLEDIDQQLEHWTQAVHTASDNNIPTITHRIVPGIKPNNTTRQLQAEYDQTLHDIGTHGPTLERYRQMNRLRHDIRTEYKRLHDDVWNDIIRDLDTEDDPTKFWKTVRRLQGTNKQETPYLKDHNNTKLHTPEEKERLFRNHWTKIFSDEDPDENNFDYEHIEDIQHRLNTDFDTIRTHDYADINRLGPGCPPITHRELITNLQTFKHKAPGPTGITTPQIKNLPLNMLHYLTHIFNLSLSAGYFPDSLKHATMIFIPKTQTSQHNVINYRPISLLDIQGKLFDKILNTRLTQHLNTHNIHNTRQHGFRKNRGTHTALATLTEFLAGSMRREDRLCVDVVLRDVAKAFDKVWHTGLKYKITTLHLHPCFTKTLADYLTDRTASIRISTYTGPPFPLHSGVPQGACLSPTLYTFYTADMPPPLPNTDYIAFADDITQITAGRYKPADAARNTQHA